MAEFEPFFEGLKTAFEKIVRSYETSGMNPEEIEAGDEDRRTGASLAYAAGALRSRLARGGASIAEIDQYEKALKHHHDHVVALTDSPIERAILPFLVSADLRCLRTKVIRTARPSEDAYPRPNDLVIIPQLPIGRHRLDFGLVLSANDRRLILAFECDGKAFHRDPDDHSRDRYLAAFGVATVRASGKEIFNDPLGCVARIDDAFTSWLDGTMRFAT